MDKKKRLSFFTVIPWVMVAASLLLIFGLTLQDKKGTTKLSEGTRETMVTVAVNSGASAEAVDSAWWNDSKNIRRLAHVPEFLLLGISITLALRHMTYFIVRGFGCCAAVSLLDETLKGILPNREFDFIDMGFDLIGYAFGIVIGVMLLTLVSFIRTRSKRIKK